MRPGYLAMLAMGAEPESVRTQRCRDHISRPQASNDDAVDPWEYLNRWRRGGLIAAVREDIEVSEDLLVTLCERDLVQT